MREKDYVLLCDHKSEEARKKEATKGGWHVMRKTNSVAVAEFRIQHANLPSVVNGESRNFVE